MLHRYDTAVPSPVCLAFLGPTPFLTPFFSRARRDGRTACALAALRASAFPLRAKPAARRVFSLTRQPQMSGGTAGFCFGSAALRVGGSPKKLVS